MPGCKIFIIDPDINFLQSFASALAEDGFLVTQISNPAQLLHTREQPVPQLVVVDPDFSDDRLGFVAALQMQFPDVPLILASNTVTQEELIHWLNSGVAGFFLKTGEISELIALVHLRNEHGQIENVRILEQQRNELNMLVDLGQRISSTLDIREVFDLAYQNIISQMDCESLFLSSYNEETRLIKAEYSRHEGEYIDVSLYPPLPLNPDGKGTQSRVITSGKAMIMNDYQAYLQTSKKNTYVNKGKLVDPKDLPDDAEVIHSAIITPLILEGKVTGVIQVFSLKRDAYTEDHLRMLSSIASQVAVASQNTYLVHQIQGELQERKIAETRLKEAYDQTLEGWVNALEMREKETAGHSKRVTTLTMALTAKFEFNEEELLHIWRGALLHDIGKLVIPDAILLKDGPLTGEEWEIMRRHGEYAYEWLSPIEFLRPALEIPRYHHEHWDGSGYPLGLQGEEIPLPARIFAIIDVYDALMNDRPYREAWSLEKTTTYLASESGLHFDPVIVDRFLELLQQEKAK